MEDFIVSALKYRPATFRSVVGQHALTTTLKNAVITKKLAHAYLFCGPRGVGKTTCARIFAKTINCFHPTADGEACNECESCVSFNDHRSYNIHELDAASNNSVDDIRILIEQVRIPPQIGQYKVYIIDEVHMLSTSAFNAFLKTLEEPPRHAIFVLATTEKHKILPTILSRCQIYDFNRIGVNDTVAHLQYVAQQEGVTAEAEALNIIAQKSDGGMRDALSIFDQVVSFTGGFITYKSVIENLNVLDYDYYFQLIDAFFAADVSSSLLTFNEILNHGFEGQNFISGLGSHLRDLLVSKDPQTVVLLEVGEAIGVKYVQQAKMCSHAFLYRALEITNECDLNYRVSKNKRLLIELTLIRLCQISQPIQPTVSANQPIQPLSPASSPVVTQSPATSTPVASAPISTTTTTTNTATAPQPMITQVAEPLVTQVAEPAKVVSSNFKMPGISIKSTREAKVETIQDDSAQKEVLNAEFSEEELLKSWNDYNNQVPSEQILIKKSLTSATLVLKENSEFEVRFDSQAQADILEAEKTSLVTFLKTSLRNSLLQLNILVNETPDRPRVYGKKEMFAAMAEENPELYRLKEIFGLELT